MKVSKESAMGRPGWGFFEVAGPRSTAPPRDRFAFSSFSAGRESAKHASGWVPDSHSFSFAGAIVDHGRTHPVHTSGKGELTHEGSGGGFGGEPASVGDRSDWGG